jgi:ABC-type phosphate/phosphonate transport system substrate-binding protein
VIAALSMYDRVETAAAHDRLWARIRAGLARRGIPAPERLTRGEAALWPAWEAPDLVLGQTCGLPYRARLHDRVALVGTPDHGVPGCPPGHYCSVLVARATDPREGIAAFAGARLAVNEALSQSGWAAPSAAARAAGIGFVSVALTGAHRASAKAVAEGQADLAAIDAVTWALMRRHDGWTSGLRELGRTPPTPGLPLIAAQGAPVEETFAAVAEAIAALAPADRETLMLRGIVRIPSADYLALPIPEALPLPAPAPG